MAILDTERPFVRSAALAAELRDALGRRQKELPPRWLWASDATPGSRRGDAPASATDDHEAALGRAVLDRYPAALRPRGVVCLHASVSRATGAVLNAVRERGTTSMIAVVERDASLAGQVAHSLEDGGGSAVPAITALGADYTLELPLPDHFPRPRLYLCLGNTLGAETAVGAVRVLRVLRSTMVPGDAMVLGVALASPATDGARIPTLDPARHLGALTRINTAFGSSLDPERFECELRYDVENRRAETHLVARRAFEAEIPGVCGVRLKRGDSIRTSVSRTFDRGRLAAMLGGVGLSLCGWDETANGRIAVAIACPAT